MTKRTHFIYAFISICALIAYSGFLVKNAISEVDITEETLPYEPYEDEFVYNAPVTEPYVHEAMNTEEKVPIITPEEETEPFEESFEMGFSPIMPAEGTITKTFSETHVYDELTNDWRTHFGIDISAPGTSFVYATEDGTVCAVYEDALWGNVIEIDHGEYVSVYKNLSTLIMVAEGDFVRRGEKISGVGSSGVREGFDPHLHFEMLRFGEYVNPLTLIG